MKVNGLKKNTAVIHTIIYEKKQYGVFIDIIKDQIGLSYRTKKNKFKSYLPITALINNLKEMEKNENTK
jgi:hypothetical protein